MPLIEVCAGRLEAQRARTFLGREFGPIPDGTGRKELGSVSCLRHSNPSPREPPTPSESGQVGASRATYGQPAQRSGPSHLDPVTPLLLASTCFLPRWLRFADCLTHPCPSRSRSLTPSRTLHPVTSAVVTESPRRWSHVSDAAPTVINRGLSLSTAGPGRTTQCSLEG